MTVAASLLFTLAALIYVALAGWRLSIGDRGRASTLLASGFAGMAVWAASNLLVGLPIGSILGEAIRNAAWCVYLGFIIRHDRSLIPEAWIARLPGYLIVLALLRAAASPLLLSATPIGPWAVLLMLGSALAFCIGALVLLHSLFFAAHHAASGFKLLLFALATLWAYDLTAYAAALLRFDVLAMLSDGRAVMALLLSPLFGIAARRKEYWSLGPSRKVTFQSLSLVAIGAYVVLLSLVAGVRPWFGSTVQVVAGTAMAVVIVGATVAFLASVRIRTMVKVLLSKHLFKHRYDYRVEWLRFNATINSGSLAGLSPEQRAIKALADIMDAAGGVLFLCGARDRLEYAADFDWPGRTLPVGEISLSGDLREMAEGESQIMIGPVYQDVDTVTDFPEGLPVDGSVWLAVPLVRIGSLIGLVALGRPLVRRQLDWEDFDLLKVLGQQTATYIADARRQAELEEARRFEEFNRRFAFIIHDIKNVVSQLSLVAANAEEHGANPRFQADMTSTLRNSVEKMTTLLMRLSLDRPGPEVALDVVDVAELLRGIALARRSQHAIEVTADATVPVVADAAKLGNAIDHLVQNAIEASTADDPIMLSAQCRDGYGLVSVCDTGGGMSADFIRKELFKPFASTKPMGFGVGAGEARSLIAQMGGELEVQSIEGAGTSFIIKLALGEARQEADIGR